MATGLLSGLLAMLFGVSLQEGSSLIVSLWYILASRGFLNVTYQPLLTSQRHDQTGGQIPHEFPHPFPLPSPPTPFRVDSEGGKSFPSHINPKCYVYGLYVFQRNEFE